MKERIKKKEEAPQVAKETRRKVIAVSFQVSADQKHAIWELSQRIAKDNKEANPCIKRTVIEALNLLLCKRGEPLIPED
jgi:hypothetical protein